ncbi:hypothetical protein IFM89_031601 [Coptis chinensis]|uniref:Importin subunit beta-1/Transportin-1-like TPR repeats domain-containing protein n=1 Tax=Coptis chinensis TaxID=261450 RepID=A0A835HAA4_9MAGN|nr:hypothetical protein IFM89_031601 [Coptis chinensis]
MKEKMEPILHIILGTLRYQEQMEKSYYALAAFCDNMGEEILPFLDPLMGRLLTALQNSSRNLQETCMSTIGSVATAAEQAFVPYAERVLELMKNFMVLTNDEDLCSRARATDIGSTLAAFEIEAIRTWWHVREGEGMYEDEFAKANKVVGMVGMTT